LLAEVFSAKPRVWAVAGRQQTGPEEGTLRAMLDEPPPPTPGHPFCGLKQQRVLMLEPSLRRRKMPVFDVGSQVPA